MLSGVKGACQGACIGSLCACASPSHVTVVSEVGWLRGRVDDSKKSRWRVIAVLREQGERQEQVANEQRQLHGELSAQFRQQVDQLALTQQQANFQRRGRLLLGD